MTKKAKREPIFEKRWPWRHSGFSLWPCFRWRVHVPQIFRQWLGKFVTRASTFIQRKGNLRHYIYPRQCWVSKVDSLKRDEVRSGVFGLSILLTFFPSKNFSSKFRTLGMRVDPPTRTISYMLSLAILASPLHLPPFEQHFRYLGDDMMIANWSRRVPALDCFRV